MVGSGDKPKTKGPRGWNAPSVALTALALLVFCQMVNRSVAYVVRTTDPLPQEDMIRQQNEEAEVEAEAEGGGGGPENVDALKNYLQELDKFISIAGRPR